ncbi:MAG: hypothetical protein IPP07_07250 [Holophagales bacterium]|nr:hypothetical protein [Holophagales bacterium]
MRLGVALALGLLTPKCARPPFLLSEQLAVELLEGRVLHSARIAEIVTQRTGAAVRAGEGDRVDAEQRLGLLGIDRYAWSGSVGSGAFPGTVTAGWAWVSAEESNRPRDSSARPAAVWIAQAMAKAAERRATATEVASALRALRIPDGQRWDVRLVGPAGKRILLLETVPVDQIAPLGPAPWVLLAFRGETPAGDAEVDRLGAAVLHEAAEHPESLVYEPGAEAFLEPPRPVARPDAVAPALPPPESFVPRVDRVAITFEGYVDVPEEAEYDEGVKRIVIPPRKKLVRVFLASSGEIVGVSAEVVSVATGEYFLGGWYLAGNPRLHREWRRFLEDHLRLGPSRSTAEPLRCAWPAFLPRPRWFEEPAGLEVHVGKAKEYSEPVWSAGGRRGGTGGLDYRFSWFAIDDEGAVRYAIHQAVYHARITPWGSGFHPGFKAKPYKGFWPPLKETVPAYGQHEIPIYDGSVVEDAVGRLKITRAGSGAELGPLFLDFEFEPIPLRILPPNKPDSVRPWGEMPR